MKKKYSFLQEAPMQYALGNAIRTIGNSSVMKGAGYGAGIGAIGNVARNAMKRDDDPTKVGMLKAGLRGAATGAVVGGAVGGVGGALARSNGGKNLQHSLMNSGDKSIISDVTGDYARRAAAAGIDPATIQQNLETMRTNGTLRSHLGSMFTSGSDLAGFATRTAVL